MIFQTLTETFIRKHTQFLSSAFKKTYSEIFSNLIAVVKIAMYFYQIYITLLSKFNEKLLYMQDWNM